MRGLGGVFIGAAAFGVLGCGRFAEDTPPAVLAPSDAAGPEPPVGASPEAGPDPVDASVPDAGDAGCGPRGWTTPNGAIGCVTSEGARIVAFGAFNHPVLLPPADAGVPTSDDYTVSAVFRVDELGEFGIATRIRSDGAVFFGSLYGGAANSFLGTVTPNLWNPGNVTKGPAYMFVPGRWRMKVQAQQSTVRAKLWADNSTEPASYQVSLTNLPTTGRGFGFYTYYTPNVLLESIAFTQP